LQGGQKSGLQKVSGIGPIYFRPGENFGQGPHRDLRQAPKAGESGD